MDATEFKNMIGQLTGRPVADFDQEDDVLQEDLLLDALKDDEQEIDCSQFNELLLLVNKDRVTKLFFDTFFGTSCRIKDIWKGVLNFRKMAMLCFGNFIYAYRNLSKAQTPEELQHHLGDYYRPSESFYKDLRERRKQILDVTKIRKEDTPLLGYISSGEIREEYRIANNLLNELLPLVNGWDELSLGLDAIREVVQDQRKEVAVVERTNRLIEQFRGTPLDGNVTLDDLRAKLEQDWPTIESRYQTLKNTELVGSKNTDVYLSWDYMDIYFATSMRRSWEYEDLFDFISKLMKQPFSKNLPDKLGNLRDELQGKTLEALNVRYFDPTQSFDLNRINKGLVEALMLKRAACTVYSVQDTDTLGKDSELAATLAQGKSVIAYAPMINVEDRTKRLFSEHTANLKSRLRFVLYADESGLQDAETSFLLDFHSVLAQFVEDRLWKSIPDDEANQRFQEEHKTDLERFCDIIARSEKRIYDKRANTLLQDHPLAIQVNLDSGVANGILVVRDTQTCADLLLRILTNSMEFNIRDEQESKCWILEETLTNSTYRVVTKDQKLTNSFWNFYPLRS